MKKGYFFLILILLLISAGISSAEATSKQEIKASSEGSSVDLGKIVIKIGEQEEVLSTDKIKSLISIGSFLRIHPGERSEIENINYCSTDLIFCNVVSSIREMASLRKESVTYVDSEKVENYINELSNRINKDSVNARFKIEDGGIANFTPSEKGIKINAQESFNVLSDALIDSASLSGTKEISFPYETSEPEIKSSDANNLGINTIIGEGISNFRGSPKNRIFNIGVATEKFNGVLIKPGEEFSFVKTLGPVDGEHGYAPELVIKKDKTEPEFGGGICQVSTTAFRAAINSGLKITARRNHAYPVAYYNPQGMDATVYIPRPDLKFINNTPGYILIQTKIEGTILTFQFYGTDDGRKVEIEGPKVLEKNSDGSMKTTFTQKVTDKDGNIILNAVFNSNYDSPSKYPHPGEEQLTKKPKGWSDNEWQKYKKTHGM